MFARFRTKIFNHRLLNKIYKHRHIFYRIMPIWRVRDRYLSLLEQCLIGTIYQDKPLPVLGSKDYDPNLREYGCDWPSSAHSMIGSKRMNNLRCLSELVIYKCIPGDFIETGVWRGGSCIMMRAILEAYGIKNRKVWVADSFEGLPAPDEEKYPDDKGQEFHTYKELSISIDQVKRNFEAYNLLDEQVVFLKGWFKDTLPDAPIKKLAVLRLDGDLYESTIQALEALYHKVSIGGYIIIDDYHVVEGCKKAVHDFCDKNSITPEIREIDSVGVFWEKTS